MTTVVKRRGRPVRGMLIALTLGLVTNVLVTAWCVYRVSTKNNRVYSGVWSDGAATYDVSLNARPGKAIAFWSVPARGGATPPLGSGRQPVRWASIGDPVYIARMNADPPKSDNGYLRRSTRCDVAYGWPLLSFRGGFFVFPSIKPGTQHDFGPELEEIWTQETNFQTMEPRTMPLVPIAPGLVANTALYGGAWWCVLFLPAALGRWRRPPGTCQTCGYDRRGLGAEVVCPECGAGRTEDGVA